MTLVRRRWSAELPASPRVIVPLSLAVETSQSGWGGRKLVPAPNVAAGTALDDGNPPGGTASGRCAYWHVRACRPGHQANEGLNDDDWAAGRCTGWVSRVELRKWLKMCRWSVVHSCPVLFTTLIDKS
jgi:hypothetical protein